MAWATEAEITRLSGLTAADITDSDFSNIISLADQEVADYCFTPHYNEDLKGSADGSRVTFKVKHPPIADINSDGTVDSSDVSVYSVEADDTHDFDVSTQETVTSVNSRDGLITLDSAPASGKDMKVDYHEKPKHFESKLDMVKEASSHLAAVIAIAQAVGAELPAGYTYKVGNFSINKSTDDPKVALGEKLHKRYRQILRGLGFVGLKRA